MPNLAAEVIQALRNRRTIRDADDVAAEPVVEALQNISSAASVVFDCTVAKIKNIMSQSLSVQHTQKRVKTRGVWL
jgi:hypothetical protein